ncbi:hypothetical protein HII31_05305, partial [Pseudocercospora fuligena]
TPCPISANPGTETYSASGNVNVGRDAIKQKPSLRQLTRFPRLDSSEATPSERSSLFDAHPIESSHDTSAFSDESSSKDEEGAQIYDIDYEMLTGVGDQYTSPHLKNRVLGTKLSTITEQKSIRTLCTTNSNLACQRRVVTLQPRVTRKDVNLDQRRAVSVDENALAQLHRGSETSHNSELLRLRRAPELHPTRPLLPPPKRQPTPKGVPSWHPTDSRNPRSQTRSLRRSLSQLSQGQSSGVSLRSILCSDEPRQERRRPWRPPVSGHSTRQFEALEAHPFVSGSSSRDNETAIRSHAISPSQRSLMYAAGHCIPVSPRRVSVTAGRRSATLPISNTSMRTTEIVRRFPSPPRPPAWSLFPRQSEHNAVIELIPPPLQPRTPEQNERQDSRPLPRAADGCSGHREQTLTNESLRVGPPSPKARAMRSNGSEQTVVHDSAHNMQIHTSPDRQLRESSGNSHMQTSTRPMHTDLDSKKLCKHQRARLQCRSHVSASQGQTQLPGQALRPVMTLDGASSHAQPLREMPPIAFQDHATTGQPNSDNREGHVTDPVQELSTTTTFETPAAPTGSTTFNVQPNLRHASTLDTVRTDATNTLLGRA